MRRKRAGRTKTKLAHMLMDVGFALNEEDLHDAKGFWRMRQQDVYAWEAYILYLPLERTVRVASWETMTELVKHGIVLGEYDPVNESIEVHLRES